MLKQLEILRDRLNDAVTLSVMDVLSDAVTAMRTGRPSSNRLRVNSPWCYRFDRYDGAGFHVLLRGTGWLIPEHGTPTRPRRGGSRTWPYRLACPARLWPGDSPHSPGNRPWHT